MSKEAKQGKIEVTWGEIQQALLDKVDRVRSGKTPLTMLCWYMPLTDAPFAYIETQRGQARTHYGHVDQFLRYEVLQKLENREEDKVELMEIKKGKQGERSLRVYWFAVRPGPPSWRQRMEIELQTSLPGSLFKTFLGSLH